MHILPEKVKTISTDFILSILSSFLCTGMLQLLVYPFLARQFSEEYYGILLTVMGVANTLSSTVGNTLNNTRLIMQGEYNEDGLDGNYKIVLICLNLLSAAGFIVYSVSSGYGSTAETILLIMYIVLSSVRSYAVVDFRLVLDFRKNLKCSVFTVLGNGIGLLAVYLLKITSLWPFIFVLGEVLGLSYAIFNSRFLEEKLCITDKWRIIVKKESVLVVTNLMANVLTYLDRLLLLPLLGGAVVTTYTVASVFGKCLGIVMTPVSGVLLGYYSQKNYKLTSKLFWKINFSMLELGALFMLVCAVFGKFVTGLLYPTIIDEAAPYIIASNAIAILGVVASMTQPAILRYAPTFWQLIIQIIYCVLYIVLGIICARANGLIGFIWASVLVNIIKLLMLYVLGLLYIR